MHRLLFYRSEVSAGLPEAFFFQVFPLRPSAEKMIRRKIITKWVSFFNIFHLIRALETDLAILLCSSLGQHYYKYCLFPRHHLLDPPCSGVFSYIVIIYVGIGVSFFKDKGLTSP